MANIRQLKLTDYEGFVDKFKPKKTTDDCYTPAPVYDAVVAYVDKHVTPLGGREIVRPFWPGGDYERYEYPDGCIVIDNPPFSITSQIIRFYIANNIDFFIFCDSLTCMNIASVLSDKLAWHLMNKRIIFENGADIPVGFITNVAEHGERIVLAGALEKAIREAQKQKSKEKKRLVYPAEVVSGALLMKYVSLGRQITITAEQCAPIANSEAPYGGGFMVATSVKEELERERERERKRERERERMTEHRPMSAGFHEALRRLNERNKNAMPIYE